jgi:hypothetical protein
MLLNAAKMSLVIMKIYSGDIFQLKDSFNLYCPQLLIYDDVKYQMHFSDDAISLSKNKK